MKSRLVSKFLVSFIIVGLIAFSFSTFLVQNELRKGLLERLEEEMKAEAGIIAALPASVIAENAGHLSTLAHARLTLVDAAGKVIADTMSDTGEMDIHLDRSELQEARLRGSGTALRYSRTLKQDMFYVAVPIGKSASKYGYVRLARPVTEVSVFVDEKGRLFLGLLFAIVAVYLLTAAYLSMSVLSPLRRLTFFTRKVRNGDFSGTLLVTSQDEISELSGNINEMVAFLQERIRRADDARQKLELVFAGMEEGVMLLDADKRVETLNHSMERMINRKAEDVIGRTILEVCRNAELHDALQRSGENRGSVCEEIGIGDERPVVMDVTISSMRGDAAGEPRTILVFHDVTRLKRLERMRTDFIANVTHEIRTPLTAIIGFAETLQHGALANPEMANRFLDTIRENAERLNRLVDDLTTLSVLELGEVRMHFNALQIRNAVEKALLVTGVRADRKGIIVRLEIPQELPLISADSDRLTQILINVIDNAVKFTPDGGSVSIAAMPQPGEERLVLKIADTGPGIPPAEIPRLGQRFYRVDKTRSRELGGTGLGLSIVKHLMQAHGGQMHIDSVLGAGTTVSLFFPVLQQQNDRKIP